jgi:hypothetical protein
MHRDTEILNAAKARLRWIEARYAKNNEFHRGMRLAAALVWADIRRAQQKFPVQAMVDLYRPEKEPQAGDLRHHKP